MEATETKRDKRLFELGSESANILLEWWEELQERRGDRAELRRAASPDEVVFSPAYHQLYQRLRLPNKEALAVIAGVCAHVEKDQFDPEGIAKQMASGEKQVSNLRFRRLLAIKEKDHDDLFRTMIRVVRLLGGAVDVCSLAKALYWWNERTKKEWAYKYYEYVKEEK